MSVAEPLSSEEVRVRPPHGEPDEPVYEVIDGVRVELPMSLETDLLANEFTFRLATSVRPHNLGWVVHEILFELPLADRSRNRRPDVAFVSYTRWPASQPVPHTGNQWSVAPDLAVEFISPTDQVDDLMDKLQDYFDAGVRQVWVVHPRGRVVYVFDSIPDVRGLREPGEIDGGDILPGIRVPVSALLPPLP